MLHFDYFKFEALVPLLKEFLVLLILVEHRCGKLLAPERHVRSCGGFHQVSAVLIEDGGLVVSSHSECPDLVFL